MVDRFRQHLEQTGLIERSERVLVGYSGGADSTCLLHMLFQIGCDVIAAHLHHGQRTEADDEMAKCEEFCDALGIPIVTGKVDVPGLAKELSIGLEEAGREARYGFFRQAAHRTEAPKIATAHTQTDLVETVLFNLARGTGLGGLAGIPEKRENIVRPLLPFRREETVEYCRERGFWTHNDPANSDLEFSRARLRHRVMPELRLVAPGAESAIARLAAIAREEDAFLNGMAAAALEQSELPLNRALRFLTVDAEVAFRRSSLLSLPKTLLKRSVRLAVETLGGSLTFHQTETLVQALAEPLGSVTSEGGAVSVVWDDEKIHAQQNQPTAPFRFGLTLPGETDSEEFGWKFVAFQTDAEGLKSERTTLNAQMDHDALRGSLFFRTAQPGDRMKPLGGEGSRKLSDLFGEAGLTRCARSRLPVVCDMLGPVWVPGICLENRVALGSSSRRAVLIRFESLSALRT